MNMRMKGRFIPRQIVLDSIQHYEIIEEYPDDKYLPSYLVFSKYQDKVFQVLFALDVEENNVRIITVYYPSLNEWEEGYKTRRK